MQKNENVYHKGFVKIGKVLSSSPKTANLQPAMSKYQVFKYWEQAVCSFFEKAKGQTKAMDFKRGILTVACLSRDLAYDIKAMARRIIQVLNELIGKTVLYALHIET